MRRRSRPTIRYLLAVVLGCALGLSIALRQTHVAWFQGAYTLTVLALLLSVVAARYAGGRLGAFCFGFAVFGGGYFVVEFSSAFAGPHAYYTAAPDRGLSVNPNLPTADLIDVASEILFGKPTAPTRRRSDNWKHSIVEEPEAREVFPWLLHLGLVWIIGSFGALVAVGWAARERAMETAA